MDRLPHAPGVYRFRGPGGRVLYLGRAVDLRRRVASYWGDLRDRRHLRVMVGRVERVEAVSCDSAHEAAWLERNLLHARRPPWNRSRGEEVPVLVRLDARPRSVGLAVVHQEPCVAAGVEYFGPYLGGMRARLAVAGLGRVLPLAYAAEGLSGCQVDLGRVLGIDRLDREALLATLRQVLGGEADAVQRVRAELAACRDAAAAALAFERAGQVQAELEALDWLVAEQKVTVRVPAGTAMGAADGVPVGTPLERQDVAGWADGVLVRFEIQGGVLRSWSQRRCSQTAAQPWLAATPPGWTAFAQRNAELAAALAG